MPRDVSELARVQRWMASIVLDPSRLKDSPAALSRIDASIASPDRESAITRLYAYVNGYPARVREALAEAYPAIEHVVGRSMFADLALRYVPSVPAGGYNLDAVGRGFAAFLGSDPLAADLPFLPDLARLEWAVHEAFHAEERPVFDASALAAWSIDDWERATLDFQPSVHLLASDWPIRDLWLARNTPREEIDIELEGRPDRVLVHRVGFGVACESIDEREHACAAALLAGAPLGEATAVLADGDDEPALAAGALTRWARLGLIAACRGPAVKPTEH